MPTPASARDAKEFLVSRIVAEAKREGVTLSEVERKMLYFSETACTLPDIAEVSDVFDRDYDQETYEQKIGMLSRSFCVDAQKNNQVDFDAWAAAIQILRHEDHYILVLIADGQESPITPQAGSLKLFLMGAILAALALIVVYFVKFR